MKVVIFCGGRGTRMREYSQTLPKPLVPIGPRPILWHMMRYYAHYGHKEFILCLGYAGDQIKRYFMDYAEWESNDFVLHGNGQGEHRVEMLDSDLDDWTVTFVDTGLNSLMGERLRRVRPHLRDDEEFLVNYADCLTDCDLNEIIEFHRDQEATATILSVPPTQSFHVVDTDDDGFVTRVGPADHAGVWINGGYMVMRQEIFDYLGPGEELVNQPFNRMAQKGALAAYKYRGNWIGIDSFKERQEMEELFVAGASWWTPWLTAP